MRRAPQLFHFTCSHAAAKLGALGILRPSAPSWSPIPVVWATDLEVPDAEALGLTRRIVRCDRTERRYRIHAGEFVPWTSASMRRFIDGDLLAALELPPLQPDRWWVSMAPAVAVAS